MCHVHTRGAFSDRCLCVHVFVQISVEDADEPPVFIAPSYTYEVEENAPAGAVVGRVHAKDTDAANNPVRYHRRSQMKPGALD